MSLAGWIDHRTAAEEVLRDYLGSLTMLALVLVRFPTLARDSREYHDDPEWLCYTDARKPPLFF